MLKVSDDSGFVEAFKGLPVQISTSSHMSVLFSVIFGWRLERNPFIQRAWATKYGSKFYFLVYGAV